MSTRRIGVLGGSFDPVHVGHLAIALAALETVPLDRVLFVVARRSPLKGRDPFASGADRLAMLEAAIAGEPRFAVSRVELDRPEPSYTVDTLEALASEGQLYLILGSDAEAEIGRWKGAERVRALATLLVAARPDVPGAPASSHRGGLGPRPPRPGRAAIPLDAPRLDISSRELRGLAARGRSLRYLVPDAVGRYIEERGLYRAGEDASRPS